MAYEYKMVQLPPNISVDHKVQRGNEAASYLENVVNGMAKVGWDFYRVDVVGVQVNPGCLGAILGRRQELINYYVITFRKPKS